MENYDVDLPDLKDLTTINSFGLGFLLLVSILIFFLPRRSAIVAMILTICYCTLGQRIAIANLDFTILRILIALGWIRLIVRRELFRFRLNAIDKAIVLWVISSVTIYTLLWQTWGALIYRLGFTYNILGSYFLFRYLIRDLDDIYRVIKILAIVIIPLAVSMWIEKATGRNLFSIFGGVPEFSVLREGKVRCQGPFEVSILAGTFGATSIPLLVALWFRGEGMRLIAIAGIISATVITLTSSSSGPAAAFVCGIVGLCMWRFRKRMRIIRWGILFSLIALHVIMKAPVWYLMDRVSGLLGGSGFYRSYLLDQAIKHFNEWWLIGTKYTAHWTYSTLLSEPNKADITSQYIGEAVNGGLLTLILFVTIISLCFRALGQLLGEMEEQPFPLRLTLWSIGTALFVHVVSFFSISYFDQMMEIWTLLLAVISTTSGSRAKWKVDWSQVPGPAHSEVKALNN